MSKDTYYDNINISAMQRNFTKLQAIVKSQGKIINLKRTT